MPTSEECGPSRATTTSRPPSTLVECLLTGRVELHVWKRPLGVRTRSYWINEDGQPELFLRGGTFGPYLGVVENASRSTASTSPDLVLPHRRYLAAETMSIRSASMGGRSGLGVGRRTRNRARRSHWLDAGWRSPGFTDEVVVERAIAAAQKTAESSGNQPEGRQSDLRGPDQR